jgi:sugar phosphate isomerase/epimerase
MNTRRNFIKTTGILALGSAFLPKLASAGLKPPKKVGIQLYTVRNEMLKDAAGTLKQLAAIGYKEIESARSEKGNYYGLTPKEIKSITKDLGISLISGHVHYDQDWQKSIDEAAETGQQYMICAVLPANGQTADNYKRSAEIFNKAGEDCKKVNISFGYHNHSSEFEKVNNQTLYDVLLDNTDPDLVKMEMDLGWVIAAGNDPKYYFDRNPGRFPLWHLKDVDMVKKQSTEFGKGALDIAKMFSYTKLSGMKHFFVEQEDYTNSALEASKYDFDYLEKMS